DESTGAPTAKRPRRLVAADAKLGPGGAHEQQLLLQFALVQEVLLSLAAPQLEERRLPDEEMAPLDHGHHVAEEERQQKRSDVRAIHVGIRHEDDFVVAELRDVELLRPDAGAQGGDEETDLLMGQYLVVPRLLGVDHLATERQDGLDPTVASLLGRAARGVAFDQEQLAGDRIAFRAVRQLPWKIVVVDSLLAREPTRLAGSLARLRGVDALLGHPAGGSRILLERLSQLVVHDGLDQTSDLAVPELRLGLPLELGLRQA